MRAILIAALAVTTSALFVGACSTASTEDQKPAEVVDRGAATPGPAKVEKVDIAPLPRGNPLKDPNNILSKRSIYFDFDKFDIKDEYRPLVEAHAKYLRENSGAKMLIQGNADERGSREYNIGLGQRRSDSVKKMMTLLGVKEAQIESVSLGEEKPVCVEHAEGCWAKNRRGDVLYNGEY